MVLFHLHDAGFGPKACGYDGAGDPCPASNDAAPELMPLPPGFENSIKSWSRLSEQNLRLDKWSFCRS
jgi:hypothetical protein